ncbi:MAG: 6-hydroxymethylpterin diphosphokinase MptE-like protein [Lentisphaeria bacterium]|nr:6-hydroxymethylpterin diphosphokinase MptE-like protein [Lentisphaeria bacterium]
MSVFNLLFGKSRGAGAKWAFHCARKSLANIWQSRPYWHSDTRLLQLKNKHAGETCVIAGNGPSLKNTDFSLIKDLPSFGTNRIYLGMKNLGFNPTYHVMVDTVMLEQFWDEVKDLPMTKFIGHNGVGVRSRSETDAIFIRTTSLNGATTYFSNNPIYGVCVGATVTYICFQLAYWMGFKRVLLVGVDHNFVVPKGDAKELIADGDDQNHFIKDYYPKGATWLKPSLAGSEAAYRMARTAFERDGREIIDCTVDGKCPIFKKTSLKEVRA